MTVATVTTSSGNARKPKSLGQYLVRAHFTNTLKERIDGTLKCTSKNC